MRVRSPRLLLGVPVVVPLYFAAPVSVSEEPSTDVNVCEKSDIVVGIPVVADFGS